MVSLPERPAGPGRPRVFCKRSCRQRDFEARARASERGLGEHELVVARDALHALRDDLYVLVCAVEDADRDLAALAKPTVTELRDLLRWVLDAARPLTARDDLFGPA
jgi:hypothetical protein